MANGPPRFWCLVVKPQIGLSTPEVYRWFDEDQLYPSKTASISLTLTGKLHIIKRLIQQNKPAEEWGQYVFNTFEPTVYSRFSELFQLYRTLKAFEVHGVALSGSGSAIFAILSSKEQGFEIQKQLKNFHADSWVVHSL